MWDRIYTGILAYEINRAKPNVQTACFIYPILARAKRRCLRRRKFSDIDDNIGRIFDQFFIWHSARPSIFNLTGREADVLRGNSPFPVSPQVFDFCLHPMLHLVENPRSSSCPFYKYHKGKVASIDSNQWNAPRRSGIHQ